MTMPRPSPRAQLSIVGIGLLIASALWVTRGAVRPRPPLAPGLEIEAPITLVAADRDDLACALPRDVQGLSCAFSLPDQVLPVQDRTKLLAPYVTTDRELFLIAGLFEVAAIRDRALADLARTRDRNAQPRFTAHCKLELVEKVTEIRTRWAPRAEWGPADEAWVARARSCRIE
jgi:hypothetical protein